VHGVLREIRDPDVPGQLGERLVTAQGEIAVLWDLAEGKVLQRFEGQKEAIGAVEMSPDGKRILTVAFRPDVIISRSNSVRLWDVQTGHKIAA